jgi:DNA-binding GntR family transcriptional regulator
MIIHRVPAPIRQQTAQNLRNAIIEGQFNPGERLLERELCELTGVSRTSVREALRQLETEGLVEVIPNKGPCVAALTPDEAKDICEVRQVLEALAARLFAERANGSRTNALRRAVNRMEKAYANGSPKSMIEKSDIFYDVLLEGCGNKSVDPILKSLHARLTILRKISMSRPGRPAQSIQEINRILEFIERRDPDGAWEATMKHLRHCEEAAMEMLRRLKEEESEGQREPKNVQRPQGR